MGKGLIGSAPAATRSMAAALSLSGSADTAPVMAIRANAEIVNAFMIPSVLLKCVNHMATLCEPHGQHSAPLGCRQILLRIKYISFRIVLTFGLATLNVRARASARYLLGSVIDQRGSAIDQINHQFY
jgi:hypothetical protein